MTSILHTFAAYESHLEHLKTGLSNPDNYTASPATNAVPVSSDSLRLAADELKADMAKISNEIDGYVSRPLCSVSLLTMYDETAVLKRRRRPPRSGERDFRYVLSLMCRLLCLPD